MSKISLEGNASGTGTLTIASQNTNSNYTLTLPNSTGTLVVTGGAQTIEFAAGTASAPAITTTGDTNTGIFFPAADTIAFAEGGAEAMRIDSSGNVGIGLTSPTNKLTVQATSASGGLDLTSSGTAFARFGITNPGVDSTPFIGSVAGNDFVFRTNDTERARITSGGALLVGTTTTSTAGGPILTSAGGFSLNAGYACLAANTRLFDLNRVGDDGVLIAFWQAGTEEGNISVSGNTVSYNAFAGSHWSQLQQGRGYNPEIPRGTVMSSIGEMCEWKSVVWDEVIEHPAVPAVEAKEAVLDEEGNVIEPAVEAVEGKDAWTETINKREAYLGNLAIGATFTEDGVTKTVVDDGNERLPKVKISDVVGDKAVYGVFQTWDEVQDMLVTSLGAFVVRIAAGVTVQIGDLLESNGDGCAKVQDDDVIRSRTIGKVTSTTPSATYDDGSYTVPCVIYCG